MGWVEGTFMVLRLREMTYLLDEGASLMCYCVWVHGEAFEGRDVNEDAMAAVMNVEIVKDRIYRNLQLYRFFDLASPSTPKVQILASCLSACTIGMGRSHPPSSA